MSAERTAGTAERPSPPAGTPSPPAGPPARSAARRRAGDLRKAWRRFTSMRTAILLLFVLAAGASVGSMIPQRPISELSVLRWKASHQAYAGVAEHLGLFDVYGSAWFTVLYVLLLASLVGCLLPRYRAFLRVAGSRPKAGAGGDLVHEAATPRPAEQVLAAARSVLRRRRYRTVVSGSAVVAEKGHSREAGSLAFHTAFLVLLVGIAIGKGFGFSGQVAVVVGDAFTDTRVAYDSVREGRFFGDRYRGFTLEVRDFDVTYSSGWLPKEFVSHVALYQGPRLVRATDVRVNNPLVYRGVSVYQLAWGWAPVVRVTQNGKVLSDGPVIFLEDRGTWRGVVKVPQARPQQMGLELYFFNDLEVTKQAQPFNRTPLANRPVVFVQEYRGDLGLNVPQSVYALDKTRLAAGAVGAVGLSGSFDLPGGVKVSFPQLKEYTVFQVASDPGAPVALAAAVLILVSLVPALYGSRRRVWVGVEETAGGSLVRVRGLALQRKAAFEAEFSSIVRDVGRSLGSDAEQGAER